MKPNEKKCPFCAETIEAAAGLLQRPTGIVSHQAFHRDPRTRCAQPPSCISLAHHVNTEGQMGKPQTIVLNREARRRPS